MEELTNIKIEFDQIPENAVTEKINLLLASGDYPDIFIKCALGLSKRV